MNDTTTAGASAPAAAVVQYVRRLTFTDGSTLDTLIPDRRVWPELARAQRGLDAYSTYGTGIARVEILCTTTVTMVVAQ
jgi:hypothetical protein